MKQLPILIITILIIGALSVMAKSRSGSNPAEDTRKADYIYLEALRGQIAGQKRCGLFTASAGKGAQL